MSPPPGVWWASQLRLTQISHQKSPAEGKQPSDYVNYNAFSFTSGKWYSLSMQAKGRPTLCTCTSNVRKKQHSLSICKTELPVCNRFATASYNTCRSTCTCVYVHYTRYTFKTINQNWVLASTCSTCTFTNVKVLPWEDSGRSMYFLQ